MGMKRLCRPTLTRNDEGAQWENLAKLKRTFGRLLIDIYPNLRIVKWGRSGNKEACRRITRKQAKQAMSLYVVVLEPNTSDTIESASY